MLYLGVTGAAVATIAAQAVSAIWIVAHFWRGSSVLRIYRSTLKVTLSRSWDIVKIGAPPFLRIIIGSLIMIILNNSLLHYGGDIAVSAMGVIFSIHSLMLMPLMGLSNGLNQ